METALKWSELGGETFITRRYAEHGDERWSAFNPSIMQALNGEYWMAFRSSNYKFTYNRDLVLTHGNRVKNRTFIGRVNPTTWLLDESTVQEIDFSHLGPFIRGPEDPRLYWNGKQYCMSMTVLEAVVPVARICVITLESLENPKAMTYEVLAVMNESRVEKNWMPIHKIGKLAKSKTDFIYSPTLQLSRGVFSPLNNESYEYRGGSQVIPVGDGTNIAVVHEVYNKRTKHAVSMTTFAGSRDLQHYTHRLVRMDEKFTILQMSDPFHFFDEGIEFAAGIASTPDGFVISYGRSDVASYIATISLGHALHSMKDLTRLTYRV
jgi:predicted GH43/DUF377 family glycosyl hydrolase